MFQRTADVEGVHEEMTEEKDLINPARREESTDPEFSRTIAGELADMIHETRPQRLIVCASPHMLGELRDARDTLPRDAPVIDEVARDLVKLTPVQLREQLAAYGLLPEPPARPLRG